MYCINDPLRYVDTGGETAAEKLGYIWGIAGSSAVLDGHFPFGDAVGLVIGTAGTVIVGGLLVKDFISAISSALVKTEEKTIAKEKDVVTEQTLQNYWVATLYKGEIMFGPQMTASQAATHVASGGSIMCKNQAAAEYIIYINNYKNAVGPERHGNKDESYFWHYHPTRNHTGYKSIHIWFFGNATGSVDE